MSALQTSVDRYLCFSLGTEEYAIPLLSVKEVIAVPEITAVPQTPPYFKGIMNLRGQVISVIDLRTKLGIKPGVSAENAVVICDFDSNSIGVIVDSVNSVIHPTAEEISDKPEIQGQKGSEYIFGVVRKSGHLVLLLDISKTLNVGDQSAMLKGASLGTQKAKAA